MCGDEYAVAHLQAVYSFFLKIVEDKGILQVVRELAVCRKMDIALSGPSLEQARQTISKLALRHLSRIYSR